MKDQIESFTSNLESIEIDYFRHWMSCVLLEHMCKNEQNNNSNQFWLKNPNERLFFNLNILFSFFYS